MPLLEKDYEVLLDCIQQLYSFHSQPSLIEWLLGSALPKLIPSDWLSYNDVDPRNPRNTISIVNPRHNPLIERLMPRFTEVAHQHPLIIRQMQAGDFPVHKISDFLTRQAYHELDLYRDVYRHLGVEYQIAATIKSTPDHIIAFALSRLGEMIILSEIASSWKFSAPIWSSRSTTWRLPAK